MSQQLQIRNSTAFVPYNQVAHYGFESDTTVWRKVLYSDNIETTLTATDTLTRIFNTEGYSQNDAFYAYYKDHLGNICAVKDMTHNEVVQRTAYYPSGLPMAISTAQSAQPYKYNGKEYVEMYGLDEYAYGFRNYYSTTSRFSTIDPWAEKYYDISPYAYCANNFVNLFDFMGLKIDDASRSSWDTLKKEIECKRQDLQNSLSDITDEYERKEIEQRIRSLSQTLQTMRRIELSSQLYSLNVSEEEINGLNFYYSENEESCITINYFGLANFIHELTHAGQFELGELAFSKNGKTTYAQDVYDEIQAYRAQYAYSPESVRQINSTKIVEGIDDIIVKWLLGITDSTGRTIYGSNNETNTGIISVNIHSPLKTLMKAYPRNVFVNPSIKSIVDLPDVYYKK